jgi:hypothetical protein
MKIKEQIADNNITVFSLKGDEDFYQKLDQLNNDSNIEYAQPNYIYHLLSSSFNDTYVEDLR